MLAIASKDFRGYIHLQARDPLTERWTLIRYNTHLEPYHQTHFSLRKQNQCEMSSGAGISVYHEVVGVRNSCVASLRAV